MKKLESMGWDVSEEGAVQEALWGWGWGESPLTLWPRDSCANRTTRGISESSSHRVESRMEVLEDELCWGSLVFGPARMERRDLLRGLLLPWHPAVGLERPCLRSKDCLRAEFLNLGIIALLNKRVLCCRGCPVHHRILSSIPGLHSPDAFTTL